MAFSEKLNFVISANASDAIKAFQATGNAADKELGKAEAKLDKLGANLTKFGAGAMAFAGVAAVGLVKLASNATGLALEVGKFSDATGLAIGDASRWIEVAGDMGVEAATLEKSLGFMNKTLGTSPEKFKEFGVEIARAKDGTVDANGTFLNLVDRLNAIADPAEKARVASQLLGRGWQDMAELIAGGSDALGASLDAVSDQKIISAEELAKAKEFRAAMDTLKDAGEDLAIALGQGVAPVVATLAETVGGAIGLFSKLDSVTGGVAGQLAGLATIAIGAVGALSFLSGQAIKMRNVFSTLGEDGTRSMTGLGSAVSKLEPLLVYAGVAAVGFGLQSKKAAKDNEALAASIAEVSRVSDAELMSQFVEVLRDGMIAGKDSAETFRELARTNLDGAKRVLEMVDALEANGTATKDQIAVNNQLREAIKEEERAQAQATETTKGAAAATADLGDKAANAAPKVGDMAAANAAVADHAAAAEEATREFYDTLVAFADGSLSYVEAVDRAEDAVADFDKVLGDADSSLEEIDDSARNAAGALIETAKAGVELDGASLDTKAGVDALKESLFLQAMSMAPDSPLRKYLVDYIADLNSTPTSITTTLTLIERRVGAGAGADQGDGGWRAAGGPVLPGNTYRVGELGPEPLTMSGTGVGVVSPSSAPSSAPAQQLDPAAFGREAAVEFARVLRQQMRAS